MEYKIREVNNLDTYDKYVVIKELISVLVRHGLTVGEAESVLESTKEELKYARLQLTDQAISAKL